MKKYEKISEFFFFLNIYEKNKNSLFIFLFLNIFLLEMFFYMKKINYIEKQ